MCSGGTALYCAARAPQSYCAAAEKTGERKGGSESPSVRGFKVDPRACFGSEDESPAGCGCSMSMARCWFCSVAQLDADCGMSSLCFQAPDF